MFRIERERRIGTKVEVETAYGITSLRIPREEIGRRSAAMVVSRLNGTFSGPRIIDLKFDVMTRESTTRAGGDIAP